MNYYPYFSYFPTTVSVGAPTSGGLINRLFRNGINWGGIINNTQKTLNIINQAIPVVKQVTPVVKNAKTMFSVMNEFKKINSTDKPKESKKNNYITSDNMIDNVKATPEISGPMFFA